MAGAGDRGPSAREDDGRGLPLLALVATGITLLAVLYSWIQGIHYYPLLPERMPTHFGPSGAPDAWDTKSWGNVFALPLVESGLAVILGGVFVLLWRVRDIRRIINVPGRQNIPAEQAEGLRVALVNLLALEESFIMVWLALLYRQTMLVSAGLAAGVPPILIWPFVIGILLLGLATLVVVFSHL